MTSLREDFVSGSCNSPNPRIEEKNCVKFISKVLAVFIFSVILRSPNDNWIVAMTLIR